MPITGIEFAGSPEEDIFIIARSATKDVETKQLRSEFDQTLYEIGRTAFFLTENGVNLAIQKRCESEGPLGEVEKYDLLTGSDENDGWTVVSTIDQDRNIFWNQRNRVASKLLGDVEETAKFFKSILDAM